MTDHPLIDWTKPVEFIDRPSVRIVAVLSTALQGPYPVALHVADGSDCDFVETYTLDGQSREDDAPSIRNVPEKITVRGWLNVYPRGGSYEASGLHLTKEHADRIATPGRIACIEVHGEGGRLP